MPRLRVEFDAGWSREKMRVVSSRLRQELAFFGGVSNVSDIMALDEVPPAPPPLQHFYCNAPNFGKGCKAEWDAEIFQPCPACNGRRWVHKGQRPSQESEPEVAATT